MGYSSLKPVVFLYTIGIICLRGNLFAEVGYFTLIPIACLSLVVILRCPKRITFSRAIFFILGILLAYILSTAIAIVRAPELSIIIIKNHVTLIIPMVLIVLLWEHKQLRNKALRIMIIMNVVIIISALVSTGLYYGFGFYWKLYTIHYDYYIPAEVHFPFTIFYGSPFKSSVFYFPRLLSIYRESGITQTFLLFSFFKVDTLFTSRRNLLKWILILGTILTLSTAALISLIFMFAHLILNKYGWHFSFKRALTFVVIGILGFVSFYYIPVVGLKDKMEGQSYNYRFGAQEKSFKVLEEVPVFGSGFQNRMGLVIPPANLVIAIYQLGIPIWIFVCFCYFYVAIKKKAPPLKKLTEFTPIFLSLFFSQPLYFQPLFLFYFADLVENDIHEVSNGSD